MNPLFSVGYLPGEKELRTSGQQVLDFVSAVDPAQGIMRGMAASGRAFDSELSDEERKAAGIEAALETLAPVGMGVIGALAKQPAKAVLMDTLTLTGAPSDAVPVPPKTSDGPTRRQVLAGIGSLAIAPEAVLQAGKKVGVKAAVTPLASRLAGLKDISRGVVPDIMRQDELTDIQDELQSGDYRLPNEDGIFEDPYKDAGILPPKSNEMVELDGRIQEASDKYYAESMPLFDEVAEASLSEIKDLDLDSLLVIHQQQRNHPVGYAVTEEKMDDIRDIIMSKVTADEYDRFGIDEAAIKKYGKEYVVRSLEDRLTSANILIGVTKLPFHYADGGRVASRLTGLGSMGYMI